MKKQKNLKAFPEDFLWGASTSAHQVEGGNHNQWSVWELESAKALAKQAEYKNVWMPRWDEYKKDAHKPENYVSGRGADHFNRYKEDFDLLLKLNMNAFRFSIEWSRIQPNSEKDWNHEAVEHYREYIRELKLRGIEPVVTLWHFTHPAWFEEKGAFSKYNNLKYFVTFADRVMRELGREVKYVITVNEPDSYCFNGFYTADWPPQKQSLFTGIETYRNLLIAHNLIYKKLKKHKRPYMISLAKLYNHFYAADNRLSSRLSAWGRRFLTDNIVIYRVKHRLDFIAVNYYFADRMRGFATDTPNLKQSDLGWDMQPQFIGDVLVRLHKKYKKPLLITENGLADAGDTYRRWWLEETIKAITRAQLRGVRLLGYMHWSLIDNFEWAFGFWPRFGLIKIDYRTGKRTPRGSALWFGGVIGRLRAKSKG